MTAPLLRISGTDRVMVLAVHPDDESLATGGLLQRAVAAGAAVRVIFVTDGENNPWPQRALERRWRIGPAERARWGQRRRREALAALARLGVAAAHARFLGWLDQGLTRLLLEAETVRATAERLAGHLQTWRPTRLFVPSLADLHPDHNALAVLVQLALRKPPETGDRASRPGVFQYLVHGQVSPDPDAGISLPLFVWEKRTKRAAIAEHTSQLLLSRRRFLAYATDVERFTPVPAPDAGVLSPDRGHDLIAAAPGRPAWTCQLRDRPSFLDPLTLCLVAAVPGRNGRITTWNLPLGRNGGARGGVEARIQGERLSVHLPPDWSATGPRVFVKLRRGRTFLDAGGWREILLTPALVPTRNRVRSPQPVLAA